MAMVAPESGKQFPKPATGKYIGTIIDVVDLGICTPKNPNPAFPAAPVHRIQVIWLLNVVDKEGKLVEYSEAPPFKMGEGGGKFKPTRLYTIASGVLGGAPPRPFDAELLLGKSNELFIVKTGEGDNARSEIAGFLPVPPGVQPPYITGYVRKANRPTTANPTANAAPAITTAAPAQPAQPREVQF
jgi:hypothetical protein